MNAKTTAPLSGTSAFGSIRGFQTSVNPPAFLLGGDLPVHRIGYGAMRLCGQPGNFGPFADWAAGEKLLRRAVELGVTFIDTAEAYGPGCNEDGGAGMPCVRHQDGDLTEGSDGKHTRRRIGSGSDLPLQRRTWAAAQ